MDPTEQTTPPDDPDDLDGCEIGDVAPDDDETADLRALFPDGVADEAKATEWNELFDA